MAAILHYRRAYSLQLETADVTPNPLSFTFKHTQAIVLITNINLGNGKRVGVFKYVSNISDDQVLGSRRVINPRRMHEGYGSRSMCPLPR